MSGVGCDGRRRDILKRGIVIALIFLGLLAIGPAMAKAGETGLPPAEPPMAFLRQIAGVLGDNPHGPYVSTTDKCAVCHNTHSATYARLLVQPNDEASDDKICTQCHGPGGGASEVSTHSNKDYSGAEQAPFYLVCADCHSPHSSANLNLIKSSILITRTPEITAAVSFTATAGAGSFDDGFDDGERDSLCVVCHVRTAHNNQKSVELLNQGHAPVGSNCTTCHAHGKSASRKSGFMPADGNCAACHNATQGARRQIVDSAGNGGGTGGDFVRASHHVQPATGTVKNSDCIVCHDTSGHKSGFVRFRDPDAPTTIITYTNAASLELFCLNCHDANGANGVAAPFSDGKRPADIKGTNAWANSAHKSQGGKTCFDCHNNGHGSNLSKGLAPYDGAPGGYNVNQEEGFCYSCHKSGGGAPDLQSQFARASRHQVNGSDQGASGARLECTNCHNPHASSKALPLVNPDSSSVLWSGSNEGFCLRCHDGSPPPGVVFPPAAPGTGWNKSAFTGSRHDGAISGNKCQACHEPHGAGEYSLLKARYTKTDNTSYAYGGGSYGLCFSCHVESSIVVAGAANVAATNAFGQEHQTHVQAERSPCIHCHDAHAPADAGESGLINFTYGVNGMDTAYSVASGVYDKSTSFRISSGGATGSCSLTCHASPLGVQEHDPKDYTRSPVDTTDPALRLIPLPMIATPVVITPTITPTNTPTATQTLTNTPTVTPTPAISGTITPTPVITGTATPTATLTVVPTATPTALPTLGPTPTNVPTIMPTATMVITGTPTPAISPTPGVETPTSSPTPTNTAMPGSTASPPATATPSQVATATPSQATIASPTPSPGQTATSIPTVTPTPTVSPTVIAATNTPASIPTPTPLPKPPPTPTPSPTPAAGRTP